MAKSSIRRRLMVSVLATQVILAVTVVLLANYLMHRQLRDSFDAGMQNRVVSLAAAVRYTEDSSPVLKFFPESLPPPLHHLFPDFYRITDQHGQLLGASPNWRDDLISVPTLPPDHHYWQLTLHNRLFRGICLTNLPVIDAPEPGMRSTTTLTVVYVAPMNELRQHEVHVAVMTLAGSVVLLILATLTVFWAIRKGLSPLAELAEGAKGVSAANWHLAPPAAAAHTEELVPLVTAMETMLATLHRAFTSQREFLANAAHELKTPVAVLKSTMQSTRQRPRTPAEYETAMDGALEDIARLEKLIHSMLRLARAEQAAMDGTKSSYHSVDLRNSCEQAMERIKPLADANGITMELAAASQEEASVLADPEDLDLIWSNLLENAIRYSDRGAHVLVSVAGEGDTIVVAVRDWGTGIPAADLPYIFDRFRRADTSRTRSTGGYGLGLAIAKAMAESYHGSIAARSATGAGTILFVRLPKNNNGHSPSVPGDIEV
jgi:signal transduction histidine kinase